MTIRRGKLSLIQHDDLQVFFDVIDNTGAVVDVMQFSEVTFVIAASVTGTIYVTKTLTGGDVVLSGTGQMTATISAADTLLIPVGVSYSELQGVAAGVTQTLIAMTVVMEDTRIGD